jgi:hypothetical protein
VIANGRGQAVGNRQVQWSGSAVGRGVWSRRQSAPSDASQPQHTAVRRRSVLCCPLSEPNNVLVSSRCSIDAPDTTLPLLLSTMRAPFRCLFMHAQLHHPFGTTGLRTTAPTARHTQCSDFSWPTGSACWRLAHVAGKGRGQGVTYRTADTWMRVSGARRGCLVRWCRWRCRLVAFESRRTKMAKFGSLRQVRGEMLTRPRPQFVPCGHRVWSYSTLIPGC